MDLGAWVDAYLSHLRVERALAPNTVEAYAHDLSKLCEHAEAETGGPPPAAALDERLVSTYMIKLGGEGLGARSAARHLSAVRGFAKFLVRERVLPADPCALIERPRVGRKLPKVLTTGDIGALLTAPEESTFRGLRDRAMLHVMYAAGLRVSEVVGLKLGELDTRRSRPTTPAAKATAPSSPASLLPAAKLQATAAAARAVLRPQRLLGAAHADAARRVAPSGIGLDSAEMRLRILDSLMAAANQTPPTFSIDLETGIG